MIILGKSNVGCLSVIEIGKISYDSHSIDKYQQFALVCSIHFE